MPEERMYTVKIVKEFIIEVKAPTRKDAHEAVNANKGECVDAKVRQQNIVAVRSIANNGPIVQDGE